MSSAPTLSAAQRLEGAPDDAQLQALLRSAHELADLARGLSLQWFGQPLTVDLKADDSPVTLADRSVEAALRERLAVLHPTHGILGEEHGRERLDAEYVWVIDPIDGTRSFISGLPLWGTLLAVMHRGQPVLGLVDIPALGERWSRIVGGDTLHRNDHRFPGRVDTSRASACTELRRARLYATTPDMFDAAQFQAFQRLTQQVAMRRYGGDCYAYGLLASGQVDLVAEAGLQPYDYLSMVAIIEGAGGVITDWLGQPLTMQSEGHVLAAATPALHQAALTLLAGR